MSDLVKRLREVKDWWREPGRTAEQAADRIEALEARNKLLEQSQAAQALAGLGVNVVAAHNSGLAALKAGCKEERLRAKKAEARIEALEAALETVMRSAGYNEYDIRAALAGERKDE